MINQLKTVFFLGLLTGIFLAVGYALGGVAGMTIAIILAGAMNLITFFFSDKLVLMMYKAKEADKKEHKRLYDMIKNITEIAQMPMPKVYILPTKTPNAFATGRSPKHAAVAVTKGIMSTLTERELKGVLAHEIAHIKNRDILIATIAAMVAGAISYLATMAQWAAIFGGFSRDNEEGPSIIAMLVLAILTPILATLIHLAISRTREYQADKMGAKIIKDPHALADALKKLNDEVSHNPLPFGNQATAHLFIVNPFKASTMLNLLSTHPPMDERIKRLRAMQI